MSSLRNAVKRVTHKERSQPQRRKHLGLLEKGVDYRERSRDYHRKRDRLKSLSEKASFRNPDEFYFGMNTARVDTSGDRPNGKLHQKTQRALEREREREIGFHAVRLMKDQDLSYVRMQKQMDRRKLERLQSSLHFLEHEYPHQDEEEDDDDENDQHAKEEKAHAKNGGRRGKHTIFVHTEEEAQNFDIVKHFDTIPEMVNRAYNRRRVSDLRKEAGLEDEEQEAEDANANDDEYDTTTNIDKNNSRQHEDDDDDRKKSKKKNRAANNNNKNSMLEAAAAATATASAWTEEELSHDRRDRMKWAKKLARARSGAYSELKARSERIRVMERAVSHLETEKLMFVKGRKRKIREAENGRPAQYKWRRRRLS